MDSAPDDDDASIEDQAASTRIALGPLGRIVTESAPIDDNDLELLKRLDLTPPPAPLPGAVPLGNGRAMTAELANRTAAEQTPISIVLAAMPNAGKTTLFATLYERFQTGRISDILFAGSETLVGFEERALLARVGFGRITPDILRTPSGELARYLHLRVRRAGKTHTLWFADVSGETFRKFIAHPADSDVIGLLRRADHLVILIDGHDLANASSAARAVQEASLLTRALAEQHAAGCHTRVAFAITKWDEMLKLGDAAQERARDVFASLRTRIPPEFRSPDQIAEYCITARDDAVDAGNLRLLESMAADWVHDSSLPKTFSDTPIVPYHTPNDWFDRYDPRIVGPVNHVGGIPVRAQ